MIFFSHGVFNYDFRTAVRINSVFASELFGSVYHSSEASGEFVTAEALIRPQSRPGWLYTFHSVKWKRSSSSSTFFPCQLSKHHFSIFISFHCRRWYVVYILTA
jgi:hypothetical protein